MAFSKAKILRFNDVKTCAPPPGAYNPKFDEHVPGNIKYTKDKSMECQSPASSSSDVRSVHSSFSVPSFRTPTVPRCKKLNVSNLVEKKNHSVKLFSPQKSEALREKIVECINKDETIKDLEIQLEEFKSIINKLKEEKEYLITERNDIQQNLEEVKNNIKNVNERLKQSECDNKSMYAEFEEMKDKLKAQNFAELKLLQENLTYLEDQLKIYRNNTETLLRETEEKLANKQTNCYNLENELLKMQERYRELEIRYEESLKTQDELQKNNCSEMESLKRLHQSEIEEFENGTTKISVEFKKTIEHLEKEHQNKLEKTVSDLKTQISIVADELNKTKYQLEKEMILHEEDVKAAVAENHRYEITINKTYDTVNALKNRLLNSDRDVEQLTKELEALEMSKFQIESQFIEEMEKMKKSIEELRTNNEYLATTMQGKVTEIERELLQKIDDLKSKADSEINRLKSIIDSKQNELDQLHIYIQEQQKIHSNASILIADARMKIERMETDATDYKFKISRLQTTVNDSQNQILALIATVNEKDNKIKELQDKLKERDLEMNEQASIYKKYIEKSRQEDELQQKYDALVAKNQMLEKKIAEQNALIGPFREQLENYERECQMLLIHKGEAEKEAKEMGLKYAEILGHQNYKQKLKHMVALKKKNIELMECKHEYEAKLMHQSRTIEKLKQKIAQMTKSKSSVADKENVGSPIRTQVINSRMDSPVNPLKERN